MTATPQPADLAAAPATSAQRPARDRAIKEPAESGRAEAALCADSVGSDRPPATGHRPSTTSRPPSRFLQLCDIAFSAVPFRTETGQLCAEIPAAAPGSHILPDRSRAFREWMRATFEEQHDDIARDYLLREARGAFEGIAWYSETPVHRVARRLLGYGRSFVGVLFPDRIVLDLAGPQGRVVDVTPEGWRVTSAEAHRFYRDDTALPIPQPVRQTDPLAALEEFRTSLGVASARDWSRILIWLVASLRPGRYPVLALHGPCGSALAAVARALRNLIDPVTAPFTPPSAPDRTLEAAAWRAHVFCLDTVRRLTPRVADCAWRIAFSTGHLLTEPHSGRDPVTVNLQRPVLLQLEHDERSLLAERRRPLIGDPQLAAMALLVSVPANPPLSGPDGNGPQRRLEELRPSILAVLLDAVSAALRDSDGIPSTPVTRLRDTARWALAAAPVLGLSRDDILGALEPDSEHEPLVAAIAEIMKTHGPSWSGTLSELQSLLPPDADPGGPDSLSRWLRRAATELARRGIKLQFSRCSRTRRLTITPSDTSEAYSLDDPPE